MITDVLGAFPHPRQRKEIFVNDLRRLERYPIQHNERDNTTSEWISQLKQVIREQEVEIAKYERIPEVDKQMAAAFAQKMVISSRAANMDIVGAGGASGAGNVAPASSQAGPDVRALLGYRGSGDVGGIVEKSAIGKMAKTAATRAGKRRSTDSSNSGDAKRPAAGPSINKMLGRQDSGRPPRVPSIERNISRNLSAELGAGHSPRRSFSTGKRYLEKQEAGPSIRRNISSRDTRTDDSGSRPVDERPSTSAPGPTTKSGRGNDRKKTLKLSAQKMKR